MSWSPVELHCISQHPSGHSPALLHDHSQLISIRESSSPVTTNQALYITALNPDTQCLVSRLHALHLAYHLPAESLLLCGCLPPVDSTREIRTTNSSVYRASLHSELLHLPVVDFSLFNKEVLTLFVLVCLSIQCVTS